MGRSKVTNSVEGRGLHFPPADGESGVACGGETKEGGLGDSCPRVQGERARNSLANNIL